MVGGSGLGCKGEQNKRPRSKLSFVSVVWWFVGSFVQFVPVAQKRKKELQATVTDDGAAAADGGRTAAVAAAATSGMAFPPPPGQVKVEQRVGKRQEDLERENAPKTDGRQGIRRRDGGTRS